MKISTSLLTCDFSNLKSELKTIDNSDMLHVDIMDGNFVPNISFGPFITSVISENTKLPLDIHLMVADPLQWISKFKFFNTEYITIHIESKGFLDAFRKIKMLGIKTGICVRPSTPLDGILSYLKEADLVLVMTVEPGFGGQSFMESEVEKIKRLVELREKHGYSYVIEVDGGINDNNIQLLKSNKVDIAVLGSHIFNKDNRKLEIEKLRK